MASGRAAVRMSNAMRATVGLTLAARTAPPVSGRELPKSRLGAGRILMYALL